MCRCSFLFACLFIATACTGPGRTNGTLIDVQKICSESIPLVLKVASVKQTDFRMQKSLEPRSSREQIWDMKKKRTSVYGLEWMQLRFQNDKLQAVWFGPRTSLNADLQTIGLKTSLLRNKTNMKMKDLSAGIFYLKDLEGRKVKIEREPDGQKGVTVTCFPFKRY